MKKTDAEIDALLRFFDHEHLPADLRSISKACGDLAHEIVDTLPPSAETTTGLRKLLEAKDCFVRAMLVTVFPVREESEKPEEA